MPNEPSRNHETPPAEPPVSRPRGWFVGAAAAGLAAGAALILAAIAPASAPYIAAAAVFAGVAIGALMMRRARDREIFAVIGKDDEHAADEDWRSHDVAAHYSRIAGLKREAEAASAAKSDFLATVSHEMRTPLSGILGIADTLLETDLDAEQETFVRAARISGELMLGLVDDMLDFAKIEAGRFDLAPEPVELERLVEDVTELFFSRAEAKGLDIASVVDPSLPPFIVLDGVRLRQVLINLIGNALKYTSSGGVLVRAAASKDGVTVSVADTGPGIADADKGRVFTAFERAGEARGGESGGAGLGLAIAQRIVARMGGAITISDRPGGGTVFGFSLPINAVEGERPDDGDIAHKRGLLVARESFAADTVLLQLETAGAGARLAATDVSAAALAAAAAAAGEPYDFVILDPRAVADPGNALKVIREGAASRLPAAAIVPPGRRRDAEALRGLGFDAYLVRPIRRASLMRIAAGLASGDGRFGTDPREKSGPRKAVASARRLSVLFAEDDEITALLMRTMIGRLGHSWIEAADGDTAIARAAEADLLLVDLQLPGADGFAVAEAVRRAEAGSDSRVPMIAVTADARDETRARALAAGFDACLVKPLTPMMLAEVIQRSADGTRAA